MSDSYLMKNRLKYFSPNIFGFYCVGDKSVCSDYVDDGVNRIDWGREPENRDLELIKKLRLMPTKTQIKDAIIPSFVNKLINLHFLEIPFPYILNLTKEQLPEKLSSLMVTNLYNYEKQLKDKEIVWPNIVLSSLISLIFLGDYEPSTIWHKLNIDNKHVPSLEYLKTSVDKEGAVLDAIKKFSSLRHLEIEMVYNHNIFSYINSPLVALNISSANIKFPIPNIKQIINLEMIRLRSIKSEINCQIFLELPELKEIDILNSKKISNTHLLLECKNLKSLSIINCGKPFNKEDKEKFKTAEFERLDIDYS